MLSTIHGFTSKSEFFFLIILDCFTVLDKKSIISGFFSACHLLVREKYCPYFSDSLRLFRLFVSPRIERTWLLKRVFSFWLFDTNGLFGEIGVLLCRWENRVLIKVSQLGMFVDKFFCFFLVNLLRWRKFSCF